MKKILRYIVLFISFLMTVFSFVILLSYGFGIANISTFIFWAFIFLLAAFWNKILKISKKGILRLLRYLVVLGILFVFCIMGFVFIVGRTDTVTYNENAIIVLGAGLKNGNEPSLLLKFRLNKAIEFIQKNPNAYIVVSGGQGKDETISEAEAMKKYLVDKGVSVESILLEDTSTSTYENFVNSKIILDDVFESDYTVAFTTNNYHSYRAGRLAEIAGLDAERLNADMLWYLMPSSYFREFLAVIKLWVFNK